jgi:hypothetical protein
VTDDWTIRAAEPADRAWIALGLAEGLERNSYFYGVPPRLVAGLAASVAAPSEWQTSVVCTADADHEPAGWVVYRSLPTLTVAYAHVDAAFRGLGAWRALREHMGLRDGQLVGVVLASPPAMSVARKRYQAKHNWGMVLEWLA